jgi:hypothetical protein
MHAYTAFAFLSIALSAFATPVPSAEVCERSLDIEVTKYLQCKQASNNNVAAVPDISTRSTPAIEVVPRGRFGSGGRRSAFPNVLETRYRFGSGGRRDAAPQPEADVLETRGRFGSGGRRDVSPKPEAATEVLKGRGRFGSGGRRDAAPAPNVGSENMVTRGRFGSGGS